MLVGSLDDQDTPDSARDRFLFFEGQVTRVGQVRDYIEECLRMKKDGSVYNLILPNKNLRLLFGIQLNFSA